MTTTVTDSGTTFLISGATADAVRLEVAEREVAGCRLVGAPSRVGARWFATVAKPSTPEAVAQNAGTAQRSPCTLERMGLTVIVRGPTCEAVQDAVANLKLGGAKLQAPIECSRGEWFGIVEAPR